MDVAEGWKKRPSKYLSVTPSSRTARIDYCMVPSDIQLHKSEAEARQDKAEIRRYRSY